MTQIEPNIISDFYKAAYIYANKRMADKNDLRMTELISRLNDADWGTIRDRIADAYVDALVEKLKGIK